MLPKQTNSTETGLGDTLESAEGSACAANAEDSPAVMIAKWGLWICCSRFSVVFRRKGFGDMGCKGRAKTDWSLDAREFAGSRRPIIKTKNKFVNYISHSIFQLHWRVCPYFGPDTSDVIIAPG
jgi:hypothetical protein